MRTPAPVPAMIAAWLVAATMDITAAVTYYPLTAGAHAGRILQGIASGILGPAAFEGGLGTALLGFGLHYVIAFLWTVVFFVAARAFPLLVRNLVWAGVVYGLVVWAGMNLIVLPLSRVRQAPFNPGQALVAALILIICIGLPIAGILGRRLRAAARTGTHAAAG